MSAIRTTRIGGALGAVVLIAAVLSAASASGAGSAPPTIGGGGVVQLHLGNDGEYVKFQPPSSSGQLPTQQAITSKKCVATLPSLLKITPQPAPPEGAVGLFDHGIGVSTSGEGTGTPCGRVDGPSQALTLSLAGPLAGKLISFAELDIEGKFNVTVLARAFEGTTLVGTALLKTGTNSDSGPDSGDGDNYRWRIEPRGPFDTLVLSVDPSTPGGAFSLEGGADGTAPDPLGTVLGTNDSLFQLEGFTGVLDCGQTAPTVGGSGSPAATLARGQNTACQKVSYLLRTADNGGVQSVLLEKVLGDQLRANFTMTIVWDPEPASNPLRATKIDYDGDGGNPPQPVVWCGGTTDAPIPVTGQAWCLTSQQAALAGGGKVQLTERFFGFGDPRWAR
jgi:hypothetical protein